MMWTTHSFFCFHQLSRVIGKWCKFEYVQMRRWGIRFNIMPYPTWEKHSFTLTKSIIKSGKICLPKNAKGTISACKYFIFCTLVKTFMKFVFQVEISVFICFIYIWTECNAPYRITFLSNRNNWYNGHIVSNWFALLFWQII